MKEDKPDMVPFPSDSSFASNSKTLPRALSMQRTVSSEAHAPGRGPMPEGDVNLPNPRDVIVHVYHCDPYTGFLNRMLMKDMEIGIWHAGIEVYGEEWSFQYFEDTWNDPSISGLIRCLPTRMSGYDFQQSINLGPTPLSEEEVDRLLVTLSAEWPASSYHLLHNNCLTFAHNFSKSLKAPRPFPTWILGVLEASSKNQSLDAVVDYSWSWAKWWMIQKHATPEDTRSSNGGEEGASWLSHIFQPTQSCSGAGICPGPARRENSITALQEAGSAGGNTSDSRQV
eukprot:TRINITY_DN22098_c0_g1_i1.p1 TRINITY_DN22098_c0_g1~~TRINITY_DN22098_c0_g1_i1.p1  ORF type:complete len:284 (+),score=34.42 TRINITY_DN22098_c0_g1_i1:114-965(+)